MSRDLDCDDTRLFPCLPRVLPDADADPVEDLDEGNDAEPHEEAQDAANLSMEKDSDLHLVNCTWIVPFLLQGLSF